MAIELLIVYMKNVNSNCAHFDEKQQIYEIYTKKKGQENVKGV